MYKVSKLLMYIFLADNIMMMERYHLKNIFHHDYGGLFAFKDRLPLMEIHDTRCFLTYFHYYLYCLLYAHSVSPCYLGFIARRFLTALQLFNVFHCRH